VANPSHFAGGTSKIDVALGQANFAFGPATAAVVVKKTADAVEDSMLSFGTGVDWAFYIDSGNAMSLWTGAGSSSSTTVTAANDWVLLAVTKATGSVAPRFHKYILSTLAATLANGGALANSATPDGGGSVGQDRGGGSNFTGDIAVCGLFNAVLNDAEVATLCDLKDDCASWKAFASLKVLVTLEYPTTLDDKATGGTSDETARSGITAASTAPPTWLTVSGGTIENRRRRGMG
jgi:hypothetical protein